MSITHDYPVAVRTKYRPDIDGLRAVAVVSVVLFHAFPGTFPGGYVGVDVFFVISGFLIAGVLFDRNRTASFSIKRFYERRIRRIFPALCLVLASTLAAGLILLTPSELSDLGKHTLGGFGFVSNLVLWSEAGYFDTAAELKPLLHLWSLGIEEQFYIVFPLVIALLRRFRWNRTMIIGLFLVASLAYSIVLTPQDRSAAFYNPLSRVWEILVGVLLADLMTKRSFVGPTHFARRLASLFGIASVFSAAFTFDGSTLFPGWRALFPTIGAALLVYAGPTAIINRFVLTRRIMVGIGLISYPLYLWHWPLLVLARIKNGGDLSASQRMVIVLVSVGLAYLTYKLIERPLRYRMQATRAVVALVSSMVIIAMAAQAVRVFDGFPGRYPVDLQELVNFRPNFSDDALLGLCWMDQFEEADAFADACMAPEKNKTHWLIWGDSHAARLSPGVRKVLEPAASVSQLTRSSCPPIVETEFVECRESNEFVLSRVKQDPPDVVIMFGRWETYLKNNDSTSLSAKIRLTVNRLRSAGVREILLVGPAPFWEGNLPTNLVDFMTQSGESTIPRFTRFRLTRIAHDAEKELRRLSVEFPDVRYFSILEQLCNQRGCMTSTNGQTSGLTTWDYGHLTTPGAELVASAIVGIID